MYEDTVFGNNRKTKYWFLSFVNKNDKLICGYKIVYIKCEVYFCDFGSKTTYDQGLVKDQNGEIVEETNSPNDFIITQDHKGYWKLNYDEDVAQV